MKNSWDPKKYDKHARFVSDLALDLVDLLELKGDERVLDVGCGDGVLSKEIQKRSYELLGIDQSPQMVQKAKQNGIKAKVLDVCKMSFDSEFDRVFSNAALHWVKDAKNAVQNIHKALKPGGIFVAEFGGEGNVKEILKAIKKVAEKRGKRFENPWYFPSKKEYEKLLNDNGFRLTYIEHFQRDTDIDDIKNWLEIFAGGIASKIESKNRDNFFEEIREILKKSKLYRDGKWCADYVRLRVKAIKL